MRTAGISSISRDDWLGTAMYWSSYDSDANKRLVQASGLQIVSAEEKTAEEHGELVTFLWVVTQKRTKGA